MRKKARYQKKLRHAYAAPEEKADASDLCALLYNIRSEVSKLDCVQRSLPRYEIHKRIEVTRKVSKGARDLHKMAVVLVFFFSSLNISLILDST